MLFNSYSFILGFLPATLVVFFVLGRIAPRRVALAWLALASLFFYAWWNPIYLALLGGSILVNFLLGVYMSRPSDGPPAPKRAVFISGIVFNLGLLAYFKYANFFVEQMAQVSGAPVNWTPVVLPLAVSFFTFQQVAYLADAYKGLAREYHFIDYCLFVSFFPQLIAGPIVHHGEMMPQFQGSSCRFDARNFAVGLTWFVIGLFKKVVIADHMIEPVAAAFDGAITGAGPELAAAWTGALAYTAQIYFDFSGYTDMALGLGWMVGIRLPLNFNSPYKAASIAEFWRRWHITLSRFLRDYLYIPLGGNRQHTGRTLVNLMVTMLLGGLWHGAGWTFVLWGGLHGMYLVINHAWRRAVEGTPWAHPGRAGRLVCRALTLFSVVCAWVLFRADSLEAAQAMYRGMFGLQGMGVFDGEVLGPILVALILALAAPNTQALLSRMAKGEEPETPGSLLRWSWHPAWAVVTAVMATWALLQLTEVSEFLYFQF